MAPICKWQLGAYIPFSFISGEKNENQEKDTEIVTDTETDGWPFWHKGSLNTGRQANPFNGKRFYFFTLFND